MFGWIFNKFRKLIEKNSQEEIDKFLLGLKGMDSLELGMSALFVAKAQMDIESGANILELPTNIPLTHPYLFVEACPDCFIKINSLIKAAQKENNSLGAFGVKPWLFTLRATAHPELRFAVRCMWKEIARGFPYLSDAEDTVMNMNPLNASKILAAREYYEQIPEGFEPMNE